MAKGATKPGPAKKAKKVRRPGKKGAGGGAVIAVNRKARHDFFIEDTLEAGLSLQGWEVKSMRAGRANLKEGYVMLKRGEAFLVGADWDDVGLAEAAGLQLFKWSWQYFAPPPEKSKPAPQS